MKTEAAKSYLKRSLQPFCQPNAPPPLLVSSRLWSVEGLVREAAAKGATLVA